MNPVKLFLFKCFIYPYSVFCTIGFVIWLTFYSIINYSSITWKTTRRDTPPPRLLNPQWGKHGFVQLEKVKLHYVEKGDRNKPLVLFIHGFPEFWYSWRYQLSELSADYWTVALDLPGYGDSDRCQTADYRIENVLSAIHQFVLSLGRQKCIIVGHDWGGMLVWNFLDMYPDMVEKYIVINAPHHKTWIMTMLKNFKQFCKSWYCFFFQMPFIPEYAMKFNDYQRFNLMINCSQETENLVSKDDLEVYKFVYSKPDALGHAINYYRVNCGRTYISANHPGKSPSGLLIFSECDEYLTVEFQADAKNNVENLSTYVVKDANHFVQQDHPKEINNVIRSFIQGRLA